MYKQDLTDKLFEIVTKETGVTRSEIVSKIRDADIVKGRYLFIGLARKNLYSYSQIGKIINRDHTTVIHGTNNVKDEDIEAVILKYKDKLQDPSFKKPPREITIKLSGKYGYLHRMFGSKCFVCGFDEVVEVHHIIPRHKGGGDDVENLVLLCPNHHALADRGMLSIDKKVIKLEEGNPQP